MLVPRLGLYSLYAFPFSKCTGMGGQKEGVGSSTRHEGHIDTFGFLPEDKLNTGQLLLNQLCSNVIKDISLLHVYRGVSFCRCRGFHRLIC
jgi:hypothetical protein